jgi:hypothetical protein
MELAAAADRPRDRCVQVVNRDIEVLLVCCSPDRLGQVGATKSGSNSKFKVRPISPVGGRICAHVLWRLPRSRGLARGDCPAEEASVEIGQGTRIRRTDRHRSTRHPGSVHTLTEGRQHGGTS